jgi:hypothetical protein
MNRWKHLREKYIRCTTKNPGSAFAAKKPTFSVVVRDFPQDISPEEIATLCPPLSIVKAWRIVSRKTNRPTSFIRVLTTDKLTVDHMLETVLITTEGIEIGSRRKLNPVVTLTGLETGWKEEEIV